MPIHPEIEMLAQLAKEVGLIQDFDGYTAQEVRDAYASASVNVPRPELPMAVQELSVAGAAGDLPARLYRPDTDTAGRGIVFFHGGGFVLGDLDIHDGTCRDLASAVGASVVSVGYRLAPEHPFPAAPEDAYAATRWVAEHAGELGLGRQALGVAGDSAGGALAAVVAQLAKARGGPPLRLACLIYPVTDHDFDTPSYRENSEAPFLSRKKMQWFWDRYAPTAAERLDPRASPLRAPDLRGLPPTVIVTAEYDPLRDDGEAYAARLREAGVPVRLTRAAGMVHGFASMTPFSEAARTAFEAFAAEVRELFEKT